MSKPSLIRFNGLSASVAVPRPYLQHKSWLGSERDACGMKLQAFKKMHLKSLHLPNSLFFNSPFFGENLF